MGEVATNNSDQVYITDDNPRTENPSEIRKQILKGCSNAIEISNRDEAIKDAVSKLKKHDLLLIAGKGHETFQNIGTESLPFDDYTVTNEAIKNLLVSEIIN
jgi:UDP-N-acetylmuramoyl-L-alanyl-D-glutamate--2,6-diaminopimelate ligase